MSDERKICTFYVTDHFFGIDVSEVQEVIRYQEMTRVPLADDTVSGLINLRGQIVTALDMSQRIGFIRQTKNEMPTNIIVRTADGAVSLLVDEIGDVIDIPRDAFEVPPDNLKGSLRHMLTEVCKLDDKLLLILDLNQVLMLVQNEANAL